jgi:hypothetical protein
VLDRSLRDKGLGKGVRQSRIWAYVRDQRPWAGASPPGAIHRFAPDWKEEHVLDHLAQACGIFQADDYKGYDKLFTSEAKGGAQLRKTASWSVCGAAFTICGYRPNRQSPVKYSTKLASSAALSTTSTGKPLTSVMLRVKSSACPRLNPSLHGPSNNSSAF